MTLVRHTAVALGIALVLAALSVQLSPYRDYQMAEVAASFSCLYRRATPVFSSIHSRTSATPASSA